MSYNGRDEDVKDPRDDWDEYKSACEHYIGKIRADPNVVMSIETPIPRVNHLMIAAATCDDSVTRAILELRPDQVYPADRSHSLCLSCACVVGRKGYEDRRVCYGAGTVSVFLPSP
jgi:hypothetical protein